MSAEKLREAARLMRERAEAATPGPWQKRRGPGEHVATVPDENARYYILADVYGRPNMRHIASWHPAVALAVADSLEEAAAAFDSHMARQMDPLRRFHGLWLAEAERKHERALTVARAYLNEVQS